MERQRNDWFQPASPQPVDPFGWRPGPRGSGSGL
jgi:hypothetical protein